jgi:hypothetical protein
MSNFVKIQNLLNPDLSKLKICDRAGLGSNPGEPPNRRMEIILSSLNTVLPSTSV